MSDTNDIRPPAFARVLETIRASQTPLATFEVQARAQLCTEYTQRALRWLHRRRLVLLCQVGGKTGRLRYWRAA